MSGNGQAEREAAMVLGRLNMEMQVNMIHG